MVTDSAEPGADAAGTRVARRSNAYTKHVRLRKRREFLTVQQSGMRFHGEHFLAVVTHQREATAREPAPGRVGITVTKKVGNAVVRNRIKRMVREYVRQTDWLTISMHSVIIAKHSAAALSGLAEVAADLSAVAASIRASRHPDNIHSGRRRHRRSQP